MPLLNHFEPPIYPRYSWQSFHANWATRIADYLNERLPGDYLAQEHSHVGARLEIDVALLEESEQVPPVPGESPPSVGVLPATWSPPQATGSFAAVFPDHFEVQVYWDMGGRTLVAAIELVSPSNKDRPAERRAFASKCAAYLNEGVSVAIVDIVSARGGNLHDEVIRLMDGPNGLHFPDGVELYAASYRPVRRGEREEIDVWNMSFVIGETLPTLPLRLRADLFVPVDFESTYMEACRRRRLA